MTVELGITKSKVLNRIGYARVSTADQKLDRQLEELKNCSKIFTDKMSGGKSNRSGLEKMLNYIREDDVVIVCELDRLSRDNQQLTKIMQTIHAKGATLEILNLPSFKGVDNPNLRLLLNNLVLEIYKYQAESERERIKERQKQGIAIAKEKGKYTGRKRKFLNDDPRLQHALELYDKGTTIKDVERLTGINARTFRRYLARSKDNG